MTHSPRHDAPTAHRRSPLHFARIVGGIAAALVIAAIVAVLVLSSTSTARFVPVLSNSMAPIMPIGALALTVPVPRADIKVGDVIVFTNPNHPAIRVIHRIIHIYGADEAQKFTNWNENQLTASTKGDNNPTADPWTVTISDPIVWRLAHSEKYLGYPAIWFQTPTIRLWGFGAAGVALVAWMLVLVWRKPAADDESEAAEMADR
jgi:signal peptidase